MARPWIYKTRRAEVAMISYVRFQVAALVVFEIWGMSPLIKHYFTSFLPPKI